MLDRELYSQLVKYADIYSELTGNFKWEDDYSRDYKQLRDYMEFINGTRTYNTYQELIIGDIVTFVGTDAVKLTSNLIEEGAEAIGIVVSNASDNKVDVCTAGIAGNLQDIVPGAKYYISEDGTLTTENTHRLLGLGLSSNELLFLSLLTRETKINGGNAFSTFVPTSIIDGGAAIRFHSLYDFERINPILENGEIGIAVSGSRPIIKLGDGSTRWLALERAFYSQDEIDDFLDNKYDKESGDNLDERVSSVEDWYIDKRTKGESGGVAPLNNDGKLEPEYLPDSIVNSMEYKGTWGFPEDKFPAYPIEQGWYYVIESERNENDEHISYEYDNIEYNHGDWIVANFGVTEWNSATNYTEGVSVVSNDIVYIAVGASIDEEPLNNPTFWEANTELVWSKIDNTDSVTTVNGYRGVVKLKHSDLYKDDGTETQIEDNVHDDRYYKLHKSTSDNVNTLISDGTYYCSGNSNLPDGLTSGTLYVSKSDERYIQQIFINSINGDLYIRNSISVNNGQEDYAAWQPWRKAVIEGNHFNAQTKLIKNLGEPQDTNDAVRKTDLDTKANHTNPVIAGALSLNNSLTVSSHGNTTVLAYNAYIDQSGTYKYKTNGATGAYGFVITNSEGSNPGDYMKMFTTGVLSTVADDSFEPNLYSIYNEGSPSKVWNESAVKKGDATELGILSRGETKTIEIPLGTNMVTRGNFYIGTDSDTEPYQGLHVVFNKKEDQGEFFTRCICSGSWYELTGGLGPKTPRVGSGTWRANSGTDRPIVTGCDIQYSYPKSKNNPKYISKVKSDSIIKLRDDLIGASKDFTATQLSTYIRHYGGVNSGNPYSFYNIMVDAQYMMMTGITAKQSTALQDIIKRCNEIMGDALWNGSRSEIKKEADRLYEIHNQTTQDRGHINYSSRYLKGFGLLGGRAIGMYNFRLVEENGESKIKFDLRHRGADRYEDQEDQQYAFTMDWEVM